MGRKNMTISRRCIVAGALSAPAIIASTRLGSAAPAQTLKISHQFPGGTIDEGDFRDRLCRKFAAELEKRTNGALAAQVYPNSSLMKTVAQFSAVRKGVLDLSLYPISYAVVYLKKKKKNTRIFNTMTQHEDINSSSRL